MPNAALLHQRLIAGFVAAAVLLNFPLLLIWDQDLWVGGLPLLPVALMSIWAVLIGFLAWSLEREAPADRPTAAPDPEL
ncbi:MAG: hypothetical protein Fur007_16940 [Rhodoferax sp.]